jgi:arylmalonate decarboxylase
MQKHTLGLVVPYADDRVPDEGLKMYPDVNFLSRGTGVRSLTPEGYDAAVDKIVPAAEDLARKGVEAVMVIGTSLTFYRGPEFHDELLERVRRATGLPCSTMSKAVINGLHAVGAKDVAVSTAYSKVVNDKLQELLIYNGFNVLALESFGITDFNGGVVAKSENEIIDLTAAACAKAPAAQAALISCGGLRTLNCVRPIEERCHVPVVTSTQSAFWAALQLVGESGRIAGYGKMLEQAKAPEPVHWKPALSSTQSQRMS